MVRPALAALLLALPLQASPPAHAHGIQSTLEPLQQAAAAARSSSSVAPDLQLSSSFSSGEPARDADVRLVSPDGSRSLALGRTNAEGQLHFRLPPNAAAGWEVMVDAGPGHRDYLELPGQASPGSASLARPELSAGALPLRPWTLPGGLRRELRRSAPLASFAGVGLLMLSAGLGLHQRRLRGPR